MAISIEPCLKGEAEVWWNNELNHLERSGIIHDPTGCIEWIEALQSRFRPPWEMIEEVYR